MSPAIDFVKRHAIAAGIILMFLLTWPIDLANAGLIPVRFPFIVYLLLGYGFVIAAIFMTWLTLGKDAVIKLLKRFLIWRVELKWYLIAFLLMPAISLLAVLLSALYTQTPIDFSGVMAYQIFGSSAKLPLFIVPFFLVDALTNGEEIGWRGYVLPRLQAKYSALTATLILGFIWGLWHIPKHLSHWDTITFMWFVIYIMAEAVLLTWLYSNARGSLLLATLFHASGNTAGVFLPVSASAANESTTIIETLLVVMAAVVVILATGPEHLSRTRSREVIDEKMSPAQETAEKDAVSLD